LRFIASTLQLSYCKSFGFHIFAEPQMMQKIKRIDFHLNSILRNNQLWGSDVGIGRMSIFYDKVRHKMKSKTVADVESVIARKGEL
jgi:hypothetical protein